MRLETSGALDVTPIRDLRSIHVDRFVRVQGQVARASSIAPLVLRWTDYLACKPVDLCVCARARSLWKKNIVSSNRCSVKIHSLHFSCPKCGSTMNHRLKDGRFSQPRRCVNATCKARNFNLLRESAVTVDSQYLKLREAEVNGC